VWTEPVRLTRRQPEAVGASMVEAGD